MRLYKPPCGEIQQDNLPKTPAPVHEHTVHDLFNGQMDTPDDGYLIQQSFAVLDNLVTHDALGHEPAYQNQNQCHNDTQSRDVKTE